VGRPDEKPVAHSAWAAAQLVELLAAGYRTLDIQNAASESWDVATGTRNAGSGIVDVELASMHDPEMGF
jgi:hypothetical protein